MKKLSVVLAVTALLILTSAAYAWDWIEKGKDTGVYETATNEVSKKDTLADMLVKFLETHPKLVITAISSIPAKNQRYLVTIVTFPKDSFGKACSNK